MSSPVILHPEIYYWNNILNNPENIIDMLNDLNDNPISHKRISPWILWGDPSDVETHYGEQKIIDLYDIEQPSGDAAVDRITSDVYKLLINPSLEYSKIFLEMIGENPEKYTVNLDKFPIRKYKELKEMKEHHDSIGADSSLKYSMILYLNSDYEGGELYFKNQNILVKPEAASFIIFPATELFLHESKQLQRGVKYMCHTHIYKK